MTAIIFNLFVINKSGGLIFYKDYGTQCRLDTNDSLRLASLWHSMHAISKELSPVGGCNGIELLEGDNFDLHCFQVLTGTKIFVATEPGTPGMDNLLKTIYELLYGLCSQKSFLRSGNAHQVRALGPESGSCS